MEFYTAICAADPRKLEELYEFLEANGWRVRRTYQGARGYEILAERDTQI